MPLFINTDVNSHGVKANWRQIPLKQRSHGAERIHALVSLAKMGFRSCMTLNPQSTCYNVGLVDRPQHSPCPCCMHVLVRYWHVGTTLVHRTLAGATGHRLIERWVGQTER